mgnify:CR=1 FL=1
MFNRFFSEKLISKMSEKITQAVNESLEKYNISSEAKMDTILGHVESLRVELKSLDDRLTNKEVRDRSEYGHVQYKLNSLQNEMLDEKKTKKKTPLQAKDFL